jgi:hypothetical protein
MLPGKNTACCSGQAFKADGNLIFTSSPESFPCAQVYNEHEHFQLDAQIPCYANWQPGEAWSQLLCVANSPARSNRTRMFRRLCPIPISGKIVVVIPNIVRVPVEISPQPDETTCGPTCLHAVYRYWEDDEALQTVIARTGRLELGGTLAVFLACDALLKGYRATIYTYNLNVFDPTWFATTDQDLIAERLQLQRKLKTDHRLQQATMGYLEFLKLGGRLRLMDLSRGLIHGMLRRKLPIITGLSSTFLYRTPREYGPNDQPDDVRGFPAGHFVVIAGYDIERRKVLVMDPYQQNPYGNSHQYWIGIDRVIGAVLLGIVTHDANMLIIHPRRRTHQGPA